MSDLNKLKELAERCGSMRASVDQNAAYGNFISCIEPKDVVALFEQLEAAQQRIAELEARLTACKSAKESWKDRVWTAEAELARRDEAAGEPAFYIAASDIDNLKWAHVVEAAISKVKRFDEIPVFTAAQQSALPDGWKLVPVEPTEKMVINGFESRPDEDFSEPTVWEKYSQMSGCQQAAYKAQLCWAAMLAAAPASGG